MAIVEGIITALPILIEALPQVVQAIFDTLIILAPMLMDAAVELIMQLIEGIGSMLPQIGQAAIDIIATLNQGLMDLKNQLLESGINMVLGIWEKLFQSRLAAGPGAGIFRQHHFRRKKGKRGRQPVQSLRTARGDDGGGGRGRFHGSIQGCILEDPKPIFGTEREFEHEHGGRREFFNGRRLGWRWSRTDIRDGRGHSGQRNRYLYPGARSG